MHGKQQFPYKEAALMSSQLWLNLTDARVILQIIYAEPEVSPELRAYQAELEARGVRVLLNHQEETAEMNCVLKSQLIRLLAFLLPFVQEEDVIVTADVDAFVMTKDILKPIRLLQRKIWIYRYFFI